MIFITVQNTKLKVKLGDEIEVAYNDDDDDEYHDNGARMIEVFTQETDNFVVGFYHNSDHNSSDIELIIDNDGKVINDRIEDADISDTLKSIFNGVGLDDLQTIVETTLKKYSINIEDM